MCSQQFSKLEAEGSRAVQSAGPDVYLDGTSLLLAAPPLPLLEASGLPALSPAQSWSLGTHCHQGVSVPESLKLSVFFGWLRGHLAGLGNHVSNFL